ncbi:hypothetical protein B0H63DRAFT_542954 [Podospora didyma]|uniref:Chitin-binding type-1 domain-containing protein n=1 Tax=Podospora didyma TaxID=330526 RepID=A0AAE0TZ79_9PEZI|nr:hypothetical protein B0H63DRAFT_542954 [Podospora didyma]
MKSLRTLLILGSSGTLMTHALATPPSSSTATASLSSTVSTDGRCGNNVTCLGSTFGNCCSSAGYCGGTEAYCSPHTCQRAWGGCDNPYTSDGHLKSVDGRCGGANANATTCIGSGLGKCCSAAGYCGDSAAHCGAGCQGGALSSGCLPVVSADGGCGYDAGQIAVTCQGSRFGNCCSGSSYCGSTIGYCGAGCQATFGSCT